MFKNFAITQESKYNLGYPNLLISLSLKNQLRIFESFAANLLELLDEFSLVLQTVVDDGGQLDVDGFAFAVQVIGHLSTDTCLITWNSFVNVKFVNLNCSKPFRV